MQQIASELTLITASFAEKLKAFSEVELSEKPNPEKWSKKEVIGHLVDSAHNNLRRFIVCQYEPVSPKIVYDQDFWVKASNYQSLAANEVVALWILMNKQIANVLLSMDSNNYKKTCDTGRDGTQLNDLQWLAADYVKHLKHHLNQVIKNSFDIVYP